MIHQLETFTSGPSHKFCIPNWQNEMPSKCLHLIHLSETEKSEIRISKLETNSNNRNANDQNGHSESVR